MVDERDLRVPRFRGVSMISESDLAWNGVGLVIRSRSTPPAAAVGYPGTEARLYVAPGTSTDRRLEAKSFWHRRRNWYRAAPEFNRR